MNAGKPEINVLYTHTSSFLGGGNKVLLSLFEGMSRKRYKPFSIVPERGPLQSELSSLGVPHKVINFSLHKLIRVRQCINLVALWTTIRTRRISLIHANDPNTYRFASIASHLTGAKLICHAHHPGGSREGFAWAFKRPPHCVITPSKYMAGQVGSLCCESSDLTVVPIYNPIDIEWFSPAPDVPELRNRYGLSLTDRHVSIVGEITEHKGHYVFLKMAKIITETMPQCMFHIIGGSRTGDSNYAESLKRMAADLGISDRVHFWGFVEKRAARDVMQASDLFALPTTREGFGLVVAEAQACGVPVLSSAIQPLDEVVAEGETGFLLPPDSPEQFAASAIELLQNEGMRRAMCQSARDWVVSRFSAAGFCNSIADLYDSLLDNSQNRFLGP